jgi:hypothetical protein
VTSYSVLQSTFASKKPQKECADFKTKMRKTLARKLNAKFLRMLASLCMLSSLIVFTGCQGVSSGGSEKTPSGSLTLGTQSLNFGSVNVGSNKSLNVLATNSGNASVTISSAAVSAQYFSVVAPTLPVTISAGQSTSFSIEFSPNAAGVFNANVTIASNATNATNVLGVSGTGSAAAAGQLAASPGTLAIGNVVDGSSGSASGTLTASGASVTVTAASTNNSRFTVSGLSLPITIQAGQSTSYTVTFSPLVAGSATATLSFTSNAQPSTTTETITGTGTAAPMHSVSLSWNDSTSSDVMGYNVYRSAYSGACGSYSRINTLLNSGTVYTDSTVTNGSSYCYASTAVNTGNEESDYSNVVSNVKIPSQ